MGKNKNCIDGIVPFAKSCGPTSFASLWSIKRALGTDKIGHTGTLDAFADGLLVVLTGHLTHLVPYITSFKKTYRAVVCFGQETDTLDPTGKIISTSPILPSKEQIENILPKFVGAILQVPPVYSAIHVAGKRASDIARSGKEQVVLDARQVFIYENKLLEYKDSASEDGLCYALFEITCSKGTYIRSLARDIAKALGTCAHLVALRRVSVGPFTLEEAALCDSLEDFSIDYGIKSAKNFIPSQRKEEDCVLNDIRNHFMPFTVQTALRCGFRCEQIKEPYIKSFTNGRPLLRKMFKYIEEKEGDFVNSDEVAVFYPSSDFAGMISKKDGKLKYTFVVPQKTFNQKSYKMEIFTWDDVVNGKFLVEWRKKGTSLAIGSFDGMHLGHLALIDKVLEKKLVENTVCGIVTFNSSCHSIKGNYGGDIYTLKQKLKILDEKGLSFAVVIDFSTEFSKMKGEMFIHSLVDLCGMKYLSEGLDFCCGYNNSVDIKKLEFLSRSEGFSLSIVPDVLLDNLRVSSSKIRGAIGAGDFLEAKKLLSRDFCLDCSSLRWAKTVCDGCIIYAADRALCNQILPKEGTYKVLVKLNRLELSADFSLDEESLKLCFDKENHCKDGDIIEYLKFS